MVVIPAMTLSLPLWYGQHNFHHPLFGRIPNSLTETISFIIQPIRITKRIARRARILYAPQAHVLPRESVGQTRACGSGESIDPAGRAGRQRPAASKAERGALVSRPRRPRQRRWRHAGTIDSPPTDSRLALAPHNQTPSRHEQASGMRCHEKVNQSGMRPPGFARAQDDAMDHSRQASAGRFFKAARPLSHPMR